MYWCSYYSRACGGAHVQHFLMVCLLIYMRLADFARNVQIAGSGGSEIHILFNLPPGPCGGERGAALGINRLFILTAFYGTCIFMGMAMHCCISSAIFQQRIAAENFTNLALQSGQGLNRVEGSTTSCMSTPYIKWSLICKLNWFANQGIFSHRLQCKSG